MKKLLLILSATCFAIYGNAQSLIEAWVTQPDRSALFVKQAEKIPFSNQPRGGGQTIVIDDANTMQTIDGFGFALTGGSAELMMRMTPNERKALLNELIATDGVNIGVSYIRLSIGASDLNSFVFSYNDLNEGETDFNLSKFDLAQDKKDVIPVMKEILAINPDIKILASPWSPPVWMKTNGKVKAGGLKTECYDVYALYFVKYIQAMQKEGIHIDAVTIQNEPLNSNNTPSMRMSAQEQAEFIKHLAPKLEQANLNTKIVLFDHNLDRPDYPLSILSNPDVSKYVDGSGFHHYGGEMETMTIVHNAFPDKNLYFTEQMVVEQPNTNSIAIAQQTKRLIIDATQNWSRNVILWNFAADSLNNPHTDDGGCPMCQGAVTIDGGSLTSRNIAYYVVAHASKFVRPGSVRIASTQPGDRTISLTTDEERREIMRVAMYENHEVLPNVTFKTPEGKTVLIVANTNRQASSFKIQHRSRYATIRLSPGAVGTYIW